MNDTTMTMPTPCCGGEVAYDQKDARYFAGARMDIVDALECDANAALLDIGCGHGGTGAMALAKGACGWAAGVELCADAAQIARGQLSEVITGNIESDVLPWAERTFDVLVMSEVLEHLVDPWAVLKKVRPMLRPGARVFASSPNAGHHSVIRMLLAGRWDLDDAGVMDRTHLRWFTPKAYAAMFASAGYSVMQVRPLRRLGVKGRMISKASAGRLEHLLHRQIFLEARCD